MKRKIVLRLSMLIVLLSLLQSCRQELLQTEQDHTLQSQNLTVKRLYREQLQKEYGQVLQKLGTFAQHKPSSNGKIYTDAENSFSIDSDNAYFIDNGAGIKTYTFFINRNTPGILENLVLKDLGNGLFDSYIIAYDQSLFESDQKPDVSQLKNYLSLSYLGQKTGTDIFSKVVSCFDFVPLQTVYVGGSACTGQDHHTNPADCPCGTSANCTPPVSAHYETSYGWISYSCDDGTWNNPGVGGSVTVPMGGGGVYTSGTNPCTFLKSVLNKKIASQPQYTINDFLPHLENHLPANNTSNNGKKELTIVAGYLGPNNDPVDFTSFESTPGTEDNEVNAGLNENMKFVFMGHDHGSDMSIFSATDLFTIKNMVDAGMMDNNTLFYLTTSHGTKYAFRITDIIAFKSWANQFFMAWDPAATGVLDDTEKIARQMAEDEYERDMSGDFTKERNEIGFLKFFNDRMVFLETFKIKDNKWMKISYNSIAKSIKENPCN